MPNLEFVIETSRAEKIRALLTVWTIIILLVAISALFTFYWQPIVSFLPFISIFAHAITNDITQVTLTGVFYAHFIGGIFFIPSPDEIIFYYALVKGNSAVLTTLVAIGGYLLAQVLNYMLGLKLSKPLLALISKEKVYKTRRLANKHGAWSVFLANVTPLPAPLLTFALGIAKYKFSRIVIFTLLGKIVKYGAIAGFYILAT